MHLFGQAILVGYKSQSVCHKSSEYIYHKIDEKEPSKKIVGGGAYKINNR